jgi:hypothetical protein
VKLDASWAISTGAAAAPVAIPKARARRARARAKADIKGVLLKRRRTASRRTMAGI